MAYPASVTQIHHTRLRAGQPRPRRRLILGEDELPDPHDLDPAVGIGGPLLDFGRLGGARLSRVVKGNRMQWGWSWIASEESRASDLVFGLPLTLF